jgi:hypothetical protein
MAAAGESRSSLLLTAAVNGYAPAIVQQRHFAMIRPVVLAAAALLVTSHAFSAEDRVLRQESPEGFWDFDTASVVVVDDTVRKSQMSLKLKRPLQDQSTGKIYDLIVFQYEHDCKTNKMRVLDTLSSYHGEPVKASRASDDWHPADESAVHKYACSVAQK